MCRAILIRSNLNTETGNWGFENEPWSWWRWEEEVDAFTRVHRNAKMPARASILVNSNFTIVSRLATTIQTRRLPSASQSKSKLFLFVFLFCPVWYSFWWEKTQKILCGGDRFHHRRAPMTGFTSAPYHTSNWTVNRLDTLSSFYQSLLLLPPHSSSYALREWVRGGEGRWEGGWRERGKKGAAISAYPTAAERS